MASRLIGTFDNRYLRACLRYKDNCGRLKSQTINLWRGCEEVIPEFNENGNLPPGVHFCEWEEFQQRFSTTLRRQRMIDGLELAMTQLKAAGCRTIYIDGSFITSKPNPGDFDAAYLDFFQFDTRTNTRKGILSIELQRWTP
ncbi:MAG: hypothetical protein RH949_18130 [Coleofasciculus sp. A1-SPW-01]